MKTPAIGIGSKATSILTRRTRSNAWAKKRQSPIACIASLRVISIQRVGIFGHPSKEAASFEAASFLLAGFAADV